MRILYVQETDWLIRNPIDQHHIAEILSIKGYDFRVIDFNITWRTEQKQRLWSKRQVFHNVSKIHKEANIMLIRPGIIKLPLLDYFSLAVSFRQEIRRQIKEFCPDVIIGLGGIYSYIAGKMAQVNNIPFISYWVDIHHRLVGSKALQFIGWIIEHGTLRLADKVVVVNTNLRDYVISLGVSKDKINLLSTGVDIELFNPNIDGILIRNKYEIKENDIILLFMGRLYQFSGLKEVAIEIAENSITNIKMIVVGEGEAYDDLIKIKKKHNLGSKLILTGKQHYDKLPAFIACSDICILPAYVNEKIMKDIVPIKLYEYASMGKPIIATELPGVLAKFGYDNGITYVDKPQAVIGKAIELMSGGHLKELGIKARKFAEKNSWGKITEEFEKILQEVIKDKVR